MAVRDPLGGLLDSYPKRVSKNGMRRKKLVASAIDEWRDTSPTLSIFRENAERITKSYDAFKRGFIQARLSSSELLKGLQTKQKQQEESKQVVSDDLVAIMKSMGTGSTRDSKNFTTGSLLFGLILFLSGSQPWLLPCCFLVFAAIALPWRMYDFHRMKWTFFLVDFCYFANLATVACLLFVDDARMQALVYALADGPLAAALVVWQNAWVFGSASHSVSVLIHLLPGLAMFVHQHYSVPRTLPQLVERVVCAVGQGQETAACAGLGARRVPEHLPNSFIWLFLAPLVFYATWQAFYWLVVQVSFRGYILRHGYETSYSCLARRANKTNNFWNRFVRRGSTARRVCAFGLIQLVFTVGSLAAFYPVYYSFWLGFLWQVVKIVLPIYYGGRYQCEKVPRFAMMSVLKQYRLQAHPTPSNEKIPAGKLPARG